MHLTVASGAVALLSLALRFVSLGGAMLLPVSAAAAVGSLAAASACRRAEAVDYLNLVAVSVGVALLVLASIQDVAYLASIGAVAMSIPLIGSLPDRTTRFVAAGLMIAVGVLAAFVAWSVQFGSALDDLGSTFPLLAGMFLVVAGTVGLIRRFKGEPAAKSV